MDRRLIKVSKFLTLVLRHQPGRIGLSLDQGGWAEVAELIECAQRTGMSLSEALITEVVQRNAKQRFTLSEDGLRIRANQGHSRPVDLGLDPIGPPEFLYHGTAMGSLRSIREHGLKRGRRQHVHLSPDEGMAVRVGQRHGPPVVLRIHSNAMYARGHAFFLSENGVWLTEEVPLGYIEFPQ